jgi:uncharacterized membrane protein YraQ (UPF0718 family)
MEDIIMNKSENKDLNKAGHQGKNKQGKKKSNSFSLYFFLLMIVFYIVLYFIYPDKTLNALKYVWGITKELIPILLIVYIFMFMFSLLNEEKLEKSIERAPIFVKYILMSFLGTLSHGPIYAWYPFLKELHNKKISKGAIGSFLYSRGIKLTLLPMLIAFFDIKFVIILTVMTLLFSLAQGLLLDATESE